jgi:hypothetical protein
MVAFAEPEKLVFTEKEAAAFLTISPRKMWAMNKAGEILCRRAGTRKLYDRRVLLAFMGGENLVDLETTSR